MRSDTPIVSICCCTYNHQDFLEKCLEGFISQKTNFPFEILVHEDASTDRTANILRSYEEKYPHLIRCVYQEVNQFALQNVLLNILFPMAKGRYIALCEGDDYWTDPNKLQKQVDFLEKNPGFSMSFHNIKAINEHGSEVKDGFQLNDDFPDILTIKDLAIRNFIPTGSVVFRNMPKMAKLYPWLEEQPIGDWPLFAALATHGDIHFIRQPMSVYRLHGNGAWSSASELKKMEQIKSVRKAMNKMFAPNYGDLFYPRSQKIQDKIAELEYYKRTGSLVHFFSRWLWLLFHKKYTNYTYGRYALFISQFLEENPTKYRQKG